MTRYLKNDRGYALVLVLLVMAVFMIIGLSFMTQSTNTAKQAKKIEHHVQSIDLAEMGAQYYKAAIYNEIHNAIDNYEQIFNENLENLPRDKEIKPDPLFNHLLISTLNDNYNHPTSYLRQIMVKEIGDGQFQVVMDNNDRLIDHNGEIKYKVIANGEEKRAIDVTLGLDFDTLEIDGGYFDPFDGAIPDEKFTLCKDSPDLIYKEDCRFDKSVDFSNSEKPNIQSAKIKVNGNLTLPNLNKHNFKNSTFYITGNFRSNNNLNNASNFTLYIGGTGNLGNLNNATGATICVNELLEIGNMNKHSDVKVYARVDHTKSKDVIVGEEAFSPGGKCSILSSHGDIPVTIQWDSPFGTETYDYSS